MCGIAGFSTFHSPLVNRQEIITAMCDAIYHRGPDEWGFMVENDITLGMRRLSIVGLLDGKQPIFSVDKKYSIVFNGELYNYKDLKKELVNDGFTFQTATDTEVALNLYIKDGPCAFNKFNGMFALAIWDLNQKKLILARDRMGKKPLFYFYKNNEIIFASELKSLIKHPKFIKKLSIKGLNKFLTYEYIPTPHTIFEDTFKVESGAWLEVNKNSIQQYFFWKYPNSELLGESISSEQEALDEIESILLDAVDMRLQADVPVGVFLSGGVDSSLITAMAHRQNKSGHRLKSFSIYFNEKSYDESEYINLVAKKFDLEHHSEVVSSQSMLGLFDKLGCIMDEPMADPSLVPTYFLSKIAAKEVKTVLGGDGADELFAGYSTYIANKLVNIYNIVPYEIRRLITLLITESETPILPVSHKNMSLDMLLKQFFRGAGIATEIRFFRWMGGFLEKEKKLILKQGVRGELLGELPYEDLNRYLSRVNIFSELGRLLYLSQKMYLMDDILVKVDRASMMNSLEVRAPFLDYRMVEYAASIPDRFKLKGFKTKYILKKLAGKYLPRKIISRPKKGFGIPITEWLCGDLKQPMLDLLSKDRLDRQGIFEYSAIQSLVDDHLNRRTNNRKLLWSLLCFQLWAKEFNL